MESKVSDEDFVMILITSLPESWDNYTSSYLASSGNLPTLKSHELIAILLEEYRRREGRSGTEASAGGVSLQAQGNSAKGRGNDNSQKECFNCKKPGHIAKDCWAKGGGREGQGPKGRRGPNRKHRSNQAADNTNNDLNDTSYMASAGKSREFSKYDWILDSGSTSHICTAREAFNDYTPLQNSTIQGLGSSLVTAQGRGTVTVNFAVKRKQYQTSTTECTTCTRSPELFTVTPTA